MVHLVRWSILAALVSCGAPATKAKTRPFAASGLVHEAGAETVSVQAFHGVPILQKSFFWDGNGEVDDSGLGAQYLRYFADGVALGAGLNAATWWTAGSDVYSAELELRGRLHPLQGLPVFVDGSSGFQIANDQIPPGGTVWNFSFGFGLGLEAPLRDSLNVQCGAFYHHISNALGRDNDRNPSQNEARLWIGLCWTL